MVVELVAVYQFDYMDRATGAVASSSDFATELAIRQMGAAIKLETKREVPASEIAYAGIWRAAAAP